MEGELEGHEDLGLRLLFWMGMLELYASRELKREKVKRHAKVMRDLLPKRKRWRDNKP